MILDLVAYLVALGGVVTSALLIAFVSYCLKFLTYRKFEAVDLIVAFSELPAVVSATCCSLIVAALYIPDTDARTIAAFLVVSLLAFLANLVVFRFVEENKLTLGSRWLHVVISIATSVLLTYFFGLSAALRAFEGVG